MKIRIWSERVDHPRSQYIWNYKITLPNRSVRGAALRYSDIVERINSFIERDDVAQKHVAEYRRRAAQRKLLRDLRQAAREIAEANQRIATEGALREAEARRAARNRALVWGPGRGLTA